MTNLSATSLEHRLPPNGRLAGRVAVITGAGRGLGGTIARAYAREGARLVICDLDREALEDTRGAVNDLDAECLALPCDVSDRAAVDAMFVEAGARFGTVDILVNNAARVPSSPDEVRRRNQHYAYATTPVPRQSLGIVSSLSDDDWLKWWSVNVHGVFWCTRAALRYMESQRSGQIINVASISGLGAASVHSPGYSASKAAVISLTKTTAYDVAGANIHVNAIACGGVMTPPFEAYLASATEEQRNSLFQMVPLGRLGEPDEYANVAVFLASGGHYLVGQVISPNGGMVI